MKKRKKRGGFLGKLLLGVGCLLLGIAAAMLVMKNTLKKADAAFERGDYAEAEALAEKAGAFGTEQLLRYRRGEAAALAEQGRYAEAAGLCEELGDTGSETWSAALRGLTAEALEAGDTAVAMELMETWLESDPGAELSDEAWRASRQMLQSGDYAQMDRALELAGETGNAPAERGFLALLREGSYISALDALYEGALGEEQSRWEQVFMGRLDTECTEDPYARLQELAVRRRLEERPLSVSTVREKGRGGEERRLVETRGTGFEDLFKARGSGVDAMENDENSGIVDYDELLAACKGTKPGSVLVVFRQQIYERDRSEPAWRSALALDFQRCVEETYCPHSAEEADYLIVVTFSHENDGWYSNEHVEGLREYAEVCALSHDGTELYRSGRIKGPTTPETFTYYEMPEYLSGGAPDAAALTRLLREALTTVYGVPEPEKIM